MKVVLNADIGTLGHKGDIVEVAPGYARNYLLPRNLALSASKGAVKQAETMRRSRTERERRERALADAMAGRIVAAALRIPARAGEDGQLFGSVTNADIAEALAAKGFDIDRRKVQLHEPIKKLSEVEVPVKLHRDVVVKLKVKVVAERK